MIINSEDTVENYDLKPRARIHHLDVTGEEPVDMLTGPSPATKPALTRAGVTPDDIAIAECNEAFARVPMARMKETGFTYEQTNMNGVRLRWGSQ